MELQYKKAIAEYKLKESELPEDAKTGIKQIGEIQRAIIMLENKGQKPKESSLKKLKALDKWVYYEILDYVYETDNNEEKSGIEIKKEAKEIKDELKDQAAAIDNEGVDQVGVAIEGELEEMHKTGRKEWDIESVKPIAKKTYNLLFDTYKEGEENGVKTTRFSLLETKPKLFTLSAN